MTVASIWLKWSWRDLRARWLQVGAIAAIIALGVGTSAGLTSTAQWRRASYDASYARLGMYDLRAVLPAGTFVDAAALARAGHRLEAEGIARAADVELESATQVDASGRSTVLVPGRIVGVGTARRGPLVNRLHVTRGRTFRPSERAADGTAALLDEHFASRRGIEVGRRLRLSGGAPVRVVGRALSPENFIVLGDQGIFLSDADFAVVYLPVAAAGRILGHPGQANVLVVRRAPGVSTARARRALTRAVGADVPDAAVTVTDKQHDRGRTLLYHDIEGDQRVYDIFAALILLGAAFAAFNLTARIVEAQRREIGIGMALGVPTAELAIRPLLMGLQIALLGTALGALVGIGLGSLLVGYLQTYLPLPVWKHDFQVATYARAALIGIALPFAATVLPVWRAVRVAPIEAIRTSTRSRRVGVLGLRRTGHDRPGRSISVLPFRNVLRETRRTLLTAFGIAAAIAVLLALIGMVDSFSGTIDIARDELVSTAPRRLTVGLSTFVPDDAPPVIAARTSPLVRRSAVRLQVPAHVRAHGRGFDLLVTIGDLDSTLWHPRVSDRIHAPGIVLTGKAVRDLGTRVGGRVSVRYPRRVGLGYRFVTEQLRVVGRSHFPLRLLAWMDDQDGTARTNLAGITNMVVVDPKPGVGAARVERALFPVAGVASVQPVTEVADTIRKELDRSLGILSVVEGVLLVLALLIAFNTASINADDRAREHATMFAFGLPARTVMAMDVTESFLVGLLGTGIGIGVGWWLLSWLTTSLLATTVPDLGIATTVTSATVVLAVLMGVVAVSLAPLLTLRKLLRMDVPSTLRVVE
ncbi:MAG: FtsX-like permease family protein [Acidimicrobiia bacterium]